MTSPAPIEVVGNLAVSGLAGLAVGIEREWSGKASGPHARFAGVRTFFLLGLLGGVAGWLTTEVDPAVSVVMLTGGVALTIAAYVMAARRGADEVDGTTEAAALVVLALGYLAGLGHARIASGVVAVVVLALAEKGRIQGLVRRIGEREMLAALQFAVLALVVLPLLPPGPYGPYDAIRPRELWGLVLIFSGLNFVGYLARRAVGATHGYGVTGLLGGLVSSTAVALTFSRQSRQTPELAGPLGIGVVAASTVLLVRVLLITVVLNSRVTVELLPYLAPPGAVGAGYLAAILLRRRSSAVEPEARLQSPLRLWSAIQMAAAFQLVLLAVPLARDIWGTPGVLTSAAVLGLTDMDALTFSMTRLAGTSGMVDVAAKAIAIGILANTVLKLALTLALGSVPFRRVASVGLALLGLASGLGLVLF